MHKYYDPFFFQSSSICTPRETARPAGFHPFKDVIFPVNLYLRPGTGSAHHKPQVGFCHCTFSQYANSFLGTIPTTEVSTAHL